jgi:hypothetical protein
MVWAIEKLQIESWETYDAREIIGIVWIPLVPSIIPPANCEVNARL